MLLSRLERLGERSLLGGGERLGLLLLGEREFLLSRGERLLDRLEYLFLLGDRLLERDDLLGDLGIFPSRPASTTTSTCQFYRACVVRRGQRLAVGVSY